MGWSYTLDELARVIGAIPPGDGRRFCAVSTDTRTLAPGDVFFALKGARFDGNGFVAEAFAKGALAAVTASHLAGAGPCFVVEDTLAVLQRFAAFHRGRYELPVIAVTGSAGKTTSKDMIAAVLGSRFQTVKTHGNLNNEIGCPLSLLQIDRSSRAAVIEMGAAHRGNIAELCRIARPTESAIVLVAPAHLEGFGTIENVARTKAEIAEALPPDGVFYVNADDPWCVKAAELFRGKKVRFGREGDVRWVRGDYDSRGEFKLEIDPVGTIVLPLACRAHVTNVLLAVAVGLQHGVTEFEHPLRDAITANPRFRVLRIGDIEVIDDAYNANPVSMAAALQGLVDRPGNGARIAVLGDMLELGPESPRLHREVGQVAARLGISRVVAMGERAADIVAGVREAGGEHAEIIPDCEAIAHAIRSVTAPGDVVLVKGSRGMRMERVIATLRAMAAWGAG
jgi:UDP-N-acetylmuramoyl-tripeptide--D-alanyl-D-alanine ligase